jgi:hypothetical protein
VPENSELLQLGEEAAELEPLGKYRASRGISTTMRDVFDVLYEAGEPLDVDTIAERTFGRASGAAQGWARRVILRRRAAQRKYGAARTGRIDSGGHRESMRSVTLADAWRPWIAQLLRLSRQRGMLIRDEEDRYFPNPARSPRVARPDGTLFAYTREAWESATAEERTTGEIHTMKMESERMLGGRSHDELLQVLEIFVDNVAGFGKEKRRPVDPRRVRTQLRWLLERPTTDESRAWLAHELVRRIFETT